MKRGKLNVVLDLQWGSTGKGKLVHWLACGNGQNVEVAICDFQTNAGHTAIADDGDKWVFQQLPVSALNRDCRLLINPGATINTEKLIEEVETHHAQDRLKIHPHAAVVTQAALDWEKTHLKRISSTLKGVGATLGMKTMRAPEAYLAKDDVRFHNWGWIGDTTSMLHSYLKSGTMCLAEGAQGFDLSLNHGTIYPFVTSRDITTTSILSNAGVPPQLLGDVYGTIRTYPIRVGHQIEGGMKVGDSGPCWPDQVEITWDDLTKRSGYQKSIVEKTTVTGKVRRLFNFSRLQFKRALSVCAPNFIFLNFANHLNSADDGVRTWAELSPETKDFVKMICDECLNLNFDNVPVPTVSHVGTGARLSDMVTLI